jgi:Tfp pilus assembly protein PilN
LIEINLAPGAQSRRPGRARRANVSMPSVPGINSDSRKIGLAALGVVALLVAGYLFWSQGNRQAELEQRVAAEQVDSTRFAATIALVSSLQERQDTIRQQIDVIRDVDQRRYVWPRLMDEISRAQPAFTWLTEITSTEAPRDTLTGASAGPSFTMQGNAGSTQALTRFMKNLEDSYFIRDVTLVTSEQIDVDGRTLHRFTLEARYETPPPAVVETVPFVVVE